MIVKGRPPNFLKLAKVLPGALNKSTIFAYAPNIYISDKTNLSEALKAHEQIHIDRQEEFEGGPEAWWDLYLVDKTFRLEEELIAHIAEYQFMIEHGNRQERRNALDIVSNRLSSSLYNFGITAKQAAKLILQ